MIAPLLAFAACGLVVPGLGSVRGSMRGASGAYARANSLSMAGFEQKAPISLDDRVSLLVRGPESLLAQVPGSVREHGEGLKGVVYDLAGERLEVVAEGSKPELDQLVSSINASVSAVSGASCRTAWQEPVGGYDAQFPLIRLEPKMQARIDMQGDAGDLDYYSRHLQIEGVFNRGLKLDRNGFKRGDLGMVLDVSGSSERIKSFLRWCQRGPPLARAKSVKITWSK